MIEAGVIAENVRRLRAALGDAPVTLIAVCKTFPAAAVRAAHAAGVCDIGENYLQEAEEKIAACAGLPLTWHFIGRLQKNKTTRVARQFDWVHSVDRFSFAERLSAARAGMAPLNMLLQVNISEESGKAGAAPAEAPALARQIAALPNVALRGLMVLPMEVHEPAEQYEVFCRTAALQRQIIDETGVALDCLSMGMSGDYEQAVRAGATHIRIGSALFGARARKGEDK